MNHMEKHVKPKRSKRFMLRPAVKWSHSWVSAEDVRESGGRQSFLVRTYRGHLIHHVRNESKPSHKGAGGYEGPCQLDPEFARNVAEGLQLLRVPAHALHVGVAELVLNVDQPEHPLQEIGPEVRQHGVHVDGRAAGQVVLGQRREEVLEQLGVVYVHHAVGSHEHAVQRGLRVFQELSEKLCGRRRGEKTQTSVTSRRGLFMMLIGSVEQQRQKIITRK